MQKIAEWILVTFATYAAMGALFAVPFLFVGMQRIDAQAKASGFVFRLLILPGVVAFWPLLLRRWLASPRSHS